jgi:hypothetical protein
VASTYFNVGVRNEGPVNTPGWFTYLYADGVYSWWIYWNPFPPYTTGWFNWGAAWYFGAGRHVLSMVTDPTQAIEESNEANNVFGEQWVWTPNPIQFGVAVTRPAPHPRTSGWDHVTTGEPLLYNCDGFRTPAFARSGDHYQFGAVAITPGASTDLDLRLHDPSTGAKDGFGAPLISSAWGTGQSEFVLISHEAARYGEFDAGVVNTSGIGEPYGAQVARSTDLGSAWSWTNPGVLSGLADYEVIHPWFVYIPAGEWTISLINGNGAIDWGLSVHDPQIPYHNRTTAIPGGLAFLNGPGQDESVTMYFTSGQDVCVAVWKTGASSAGLVGGYELRFTPTVSDAGLNAPPVRSTRLASVHPNPFNPTTTVAYEVARVGTVRVKVMSLAGRIVRTLVSEVKEPGRYEVMWDGTDQASRPQASGVYVVHLEAAGGTDRRKVVLVK